MLDSSPENIVPLPDAKRHLIRIMQSAVFVNSVRLSTFLRYAVEQTLAGHGRSLKEYTIGTSAYGRRADFDPSQDTIVRTEARRLRQKLHEYYDGEGKDDAIEIAFRCGSYVPVISWREKRVLTKPSSAPFDVRAVGGATWVVVQSFVAHPSDAMASEFAFGVSEEILHRLSHVEGLCVISGTRADRCDAICADHLGAFILVGGTVRRERESLRVTVRGSAVTGQVLWSQRFDTVIESSSLPAQEAVATSVIRQISPYESSIVQGTSTSIELLH